MFQVESRAQMSCLPRMRPQRFYDIVVQVAIIRPGPIVGQMLNPYLRRRQGREEGGVRASLARARAGADTGSAAVSGAVIEDGHDRRRIHGGEAEDLRRAMGFKRSEARMRKSSEAAGGMDANGIHRRGAGTIIQSITSFALYGFPESHAASFALIAYASAYLKCHYLAAFTAAMLNNQPMGFYAPATLVKDAQRHGLHFRPIDVTRSDWLCTIEDDGGSKCVRLGLNYVKGVREVTAREILRARPFTGIQDLVDRVPGLRKDELRALAEVGALNFINGIHRRDALWQAELAMRPAGPFCLRLSGPMCRTRVRWRR